jgi:hypothetical protein
MAGREAGARERAEPPGASKPIRRRPNWPRAARRAASSAASARARTSRASGTSAAPAAVRAIGRLARVSSSAPISCSSLRMDSLSAGWESESSSAARLKLPCSATATK